MLSYIILPYVLHHKFLIHLYLIHGRVWTAIRLQETKDEKQIKFQKIVKKKYLLYLRTLFIFSFFLLYYNKVLFFLLCFDYYYLLILRVTWANWAYVCCFAKGGYTRFFDEQKKFALSHTIFSLNHLNWWYDVPFPTLHGSILRYIF